MNDWIFVFYEKKDDKNNQKLEPYRSFAHTPNVRSYYTDTTHNRTGPQINEY